MNLYYIYIHLVIYLIYFAISYQICAGPDIRSSSKKCHYMGFHTCNVYWTPFHSVVRPTVEFWMPLL